jgi:hypothetical protein
VEEEIYFFARLSRNESKDEGKPEGANFIVRSSKI